MMILVIGGTGFVGSNLTKLLVENNHDVTIMARNPQKRLGFMSQVKFVSANQL